MKPRAVRRIVTGHRADGRSTVLIDAPAPNVKQRQAGNGSTLLWVTEEAPASVAGGEIDTVVGLGSGGQDQDRDVALGPQPVGHPDHRARHQLERLHDRGMVGRRGLHDVGQLALQHGVPLQLLVDKFTHTRFEPSGFTKNPEIPMAKSVMDYIFKWLATKFLSRERQEEAGVIKRDEPVDTNVDPPSAQDAAFAETVATATTVGARVSSPAPPSAQASSSIGFVMPPKDADAINTKGGAPIRFQQDAPSCSDCGSIMVRNGACYKCLNCGSTSGCS